MRALVLREWGGPLVLEERPVPQPGPGEVLVRVASCGIGATLDNMRSGRNATLPGVALPRVLGHEVSGVVAAVGDGVEGLAPGQRVAVSMYLTCGRCDPCRWGHDPLCRSLRGLVGMSIDGGLAEYVAVPATNLHPVPEGVSAVDASVAVDAVASPWHALRNVARLGPMEALVVFGAGGGVGVHAVKVGRLLGARVIGVEVTEPKLDFALAEGAHEVIDGRGDVPREVLHVTRGRGADVVIDYVASGATLETALACLGPQGRLVVQGIGPEGAELRVRPRSLIERQLAVMGSRYASRREVVEALELVQRRLVRPAVTYTVPLERTEELFALMARRELLGRGAVVMTPDGRW